MNLLGNRSPFSSDGIRNNSRRNNSILSRYCCLFVHRSSKFPFEWNWNGIIARISFPFLIIVLYRKRDNCTIFFIRHFQNRVKQVWILKSEKRWKWSFHGIQHYFFDFIIYLKRPFERNNRIFQLCRTFDGER